MTSDGVRTAAVVAQALEKVVRVVFGPASMEVAVVSATNAVVLHSSCVAVLSSLQVGHPLCNSIRKAAIGVDTESGDGAGVTVILSSAILNEVVHHVVDRGYGGEGIRAFRTHFDSVSSYVANHLVPNSVSACRLAVNPVPDEIEGASRSLVMTQFGTHVSPRLSEHLAECIVTFAYGSGFDGVMAARQRLATSAVDNIITVPGAKVESSTVLEGLLVQGRVASSSIPKALKAAANTALGFVVVSNGLGGSEPTYERQVYDSNQEIRVTGEKQFHEAMVGDEMFVRQWIRRVAQSGAQVVFVIGPAHAAAISECARLGMMLVHNLAKDDASRLCMSAGVVTSEAISEISAFSVGRAYYARELSLSDAKFIHIRPYPPQGRAEFLTLLLRAPVAGLCTLYKGLVARAASMLSRWLGDVDQGNLWIVPAGGSVELHAVRALDKVIAKVRRGDDVPSLGTREAPCKGFLLTGLSVWRNAFVQVLLRIMMSGSGQKVSPADYRVIERLVLNEDAYALVYEFDPHHNSSSKRLDRSVMRVATGAIGDCTVVESWKGKQNIVSVVSDLIRGLLRVDMIVATKAGVRVRGLNATLRADSSDDDAVSSDESDDSD